jgi:predicted deacylase
MSMSALTLKPESSNQLVQRRSIERLLAPLDRLVDNSASFSRRPLGEFERGGERYALPRYFYLGERGGGDVIRLGIFATIHGDEPEGALSLAKFVTELERDSEIAKGFALYFYPLCNPTGFEDNTRHARSGKDLNREFWTQSSSPEVRQLESEICLHAFHGIITLHSDDTSDGLYGFVGGSVLTENLLEPALREAERYLPRNRQAMIDGFNARGGIIAESYVGVLKSLPGVTRPPFEITFETPQNSPIHRQVDATVTALRTILIEYRYLMAIAQNI